MSAFQLPIAVERKIKTLIYLAQRPEGVGVSVKEIAEILGVTWYPAMEVMVSLSNNLLVVNDFVEGYRLTKKPEEIRVSELLREIEGLFIFGESTYQYQLENMSEPIEYSIGEMWVNLRKSVYNALSQVTIADLMKRVKEISGEEGFF